VGQLPVSSAALQPFLRPDPSGALRKTSGFPLLCLGEGVTAKDVSFGELGYAREARASYLDFVAARDRGDIAAGIRFQICLPTPMSVIYAFCTARDVAAIEPAYEIAMAHEVEAICRHIPHKDISSLLRRLRRQAFFRPSHGPASCRHLKRDCPFSAA
jgi:hypothetical protein